MARNGSLGGLFYVDCGGHAVWFTSSYGCALSEGLADYGASVAVPEENRIYIAVKVGGRWRDRDDVSDFIWCLEEGVDADEHEEHFDDIPTPSDGRESATEPSNHDADDIRAIWLQNLVGT